MKKIIFLYAFFGIYAYAQWQPDMRVTNAPDNSLTSYNNTRSIAASGNDVHLLWYDKRGGTYNQIYYKRSSDGGITWSADTQFTNNTWYITGYPSIVVSGLAVYAVWVYNHNAQGIIYYKRSTDGGISWSPITDAQIGSLSLYYPSTAVSNSVLHISTSNLVPGRIFYSRSQIGGIGWNSTVALSTIPSVSFFSSIAASDALINIVWQDIRDNSEIYYMRSADNGVSWGTETRLTNNSGNSNYPSAASSGSFVHIAWQDNRDGNYEVYYKRSINGGLSWEADTRLTNNSDSSYYPSIYSSGSNVHVVWQDYRNGNWEIYYKISTDGGVSWSADTRLTNNSASSINPSVTVSNTSVYIAWSDNRDGNYEVYFKRNPTGNPLGINIISSEIPEKFSLSQNYPNPFNPTTHVRFEISDLRFVKLIIFDNIGREISTLVNEHLQPGTYEVEWDGSNYSSGVYYYKLVAGEFIETKKMILIK